MCLEYLLNDYQPIKDGYVRRCDKCHDSFIAYPGGLSKRQQCRYHHPNICNECTHCGRLLPVSANCYHIIPKTWWEKLFG